MPASPAETVDEIVERADGVPLFVEELTKAVLESGAHDNRVAAVLAASPLPELAIPATLHASLIARLDRLGPIAKEVGQIGAVIGREFGYDLIEEVAQRPTAELRSGLDRLAEAGLLFCRGVAPQSSYLFKHALVQDAAYSTLLRVRRQELHVRVAAVLEQHFADLVERQPELLAYHLTAAGDTERAVDQWLKAGQQAAAGVGASRSDRPFRARSRGAGGAARRAGSGRTGDRTATGPRPVAVHSQRICLGRGSRSLFARPRACRADRADAHQLVHCGLRPLDFGNWCRPAHRQPRAVGPITRYDRERRGRGTTLAGASQRLDDLFVRRRSGGGASSTARQGAGSMIPNGTAHTACSTAGTIPASAAVSSVGRFIGCSATRRRVWRSAGQRWH